MLVCACATCPTNNISNPAAPSQYLILSLFSKSHTSSASHFGRILYSRTKKMQRIHRWRVSHSRLVIHRRGAEAQRKQIVVLRNSASSAQVFSSLRLCASALILHSVPPWQPPL